MTAPTRQALIQALQSRGFLLVADLPKPVKVVKRRELHADDAVFMEIDTEVLAAYGARP
ncbi:hypothetical protein [uncultured Pseudomonas sp.]|uniref:hypothetical protein n=1 Tax=uncultured Pseudomonas sp. TaxID=114707 RepID=UPI0030DCEC69|tara:strand:- start:3744 stop:3920 length:177 start_codon:yes stop_codon:yes gene_type:complete